MAAAVATTSIATPPSDTLQNPIDVLVLRPNGHASLLDTTFVSRRSRRAVYATTTRGAETSLWRVTSNGKLTQVAQINWSHHSGNGNNSIGFTAGDGSLKRSTRHSSSGTRAEIMIIFNGKMVRSDEFLRKGKSWFPSDSRVLTIDDVEYKWKSGNENPGETRNSPNDVWKIWRCVAVQDARKALSTVPAEDNSQTSPAEVSIPNMFHSLESLDIQSLTQNEASIRAAISSALIAPASSSTVARFAPPQIGSTHSSLAFFPSIFFSSDPTSNICKLEHLLVSVVLLSTVKGEWKRIQSANEPAALERILVAEARGEVPPYTPTFGRTLERAPGDVRRQNRAHSSPSERPRAGSASEAMRRTGQAHEQGNTSTAPMRNIHRATRSTPGSWFGFPPSSRENRTNTSGSRGGSAPASQRGSTAGSTRPSDGVFATRRPSSHQAWPLSARRAPLSERQINDVLPPRPVTSPAPAYKQ